MKVAIAQIAPAFMNRDRTLAKAAEWIQRAGASGAQLVCFGESLVPGYPAWLCRTDGARFDDPIQKQLHALYAREAVCIEENHLEPICSAAARGKLAVVLGVTERPLDRGGHSLYCSRVYIDERGTIASIHRKLMPTYEERLCWGVGDGAGLVTHRLREFTVGALNCWENWMPLTRASLYAQGMDLHVMLWPGRDDNTRQITPFVAVEGRSFVISASGLLRDEDIPRDLPQRARIIGAGEMLHNGGSCIAGPDGKWLIEPQTGKEELLIAEVNIAAVLGERQNFDPAGHYSRPDVISLNVDRSRQGILRGG